LMVRSLKLNWTIFAITHDGERLRLFRRGHYTTAIPFGGGPTRPLAGSTNA